MEEFLYPEDRSDRFLHNVGSCLPGYMVSHPSTKTVIFIVTAVRTTNVHTEVLFCCFQVVCVNIENTLFDSYYNGCCNGTLWPLCHSMPDRAQFSAEDWKVWLELWYCTTFLPHIGDSKVYC